MIPAVFFKLVERQLLTVGSEVGVEIPVYVNHKKKKPIKGMFTVSRLYSHPLYFEPLIEVTAGEETHTVGMNSIKLINGLTPLRYAHQYGIRADGKDGEAPKKLGRPAKSTKFEKEWSVE